MIAKLLSTDRQRFKLSGGNAMCKQALLTVELTDKDEDSSYPAKT